VISSKWIVDFATRHLIVPMFAREIRTDEFNSQDSSTGPDATQAQKALRALLSAE
jgi:hypothetical protein